ncbi:MAG: nitrogenase molybdenum-iron protein subunit beta [Sterolibacteriaceae bacterium]|jgi:nitrogenase molybdenum-iron protein beta chain|uniref:Nitrogenase molybdenum-iron protein beta chain n=1 Tax=Candidatus Methylophosphatis roskildensis TaxID=2899263 RepID=A0A9D7HMM1_9PROT|nr:nitrogenase molybdenum-iron protein subunit beta [Candidatus Methylophosphatis roskildensis]MBK7236973.1 nitrogenase molybdenum-iron protein subunit beta [Sterolibacteriaceae bacterium]MBK7665707.1 nitrogenase molybdenum-iron protein subunit beta [Sterolibacteriaceae bacterium]
MPQSAEKVIDHEMLFRQPEYADMFAKKKSEFEFKHPDEKISEVNEWTKTTEYQTLNFQRQALTVNPAKACQPLGAVFAANGFKGTLPFVHGSQGCVAYYRSHFTRHFKEPTSCVSSSMTEDAAVFGGLNNMVDGLANSYRLYKPEMIAVSTTCMAEVIGDDLDAFIKTSKQKGSIPAEFDVPFAHTPAFVGSHITGYDNALLGVLKHFWDGKANTTAPLTRVPNESINFIGGFDGFVVGNMAAIRQIFEAFGVEYTILCDPSDAWNTPTDGEFRMFDGGTTKDEVERALNAKATIVFQEFSCEKTTKFIRAHDQEVVALNSPIGVAGTDELVMAISRLTGKPVPESLTKERGRLVDALADSQAHLHGKKFALYGDPDLMLGLTQFLLELGAEPVTVLSTNGGEEWAAKVQALFDASPFGSDCKVYPKKDLWHLRSLLFTAPVDFLIGNTYGKYLERDCGVPLIRLGFPVFDRHHYHRFPIWGYEGSLRVLVMLLDELFEQLDQSTIVTAKTDISYDIIR